MSQFDLKGKVALITGGNGGIGLGMAKGLAEAGCAIMIAGRNAEKSRGAAADLAKLGVKTSVVDVDVADEKSCHAMVDTTVKQLGRVDILINNAGAFDGGPLEDLTLATWMHVLNVNLTGPFLCSRAAMKIMKAQGGGRIINIGSISAQMPRLNSVPYTTTKHGLVGLTKAAALEGREHGVVVSCLHPGNVLTERRAGAASSADQEPMMTVDELAMTAVTMAALPLHVNLLEAIVLPVTQKYIGRG
jgi:NAD(P)-dependent dehydrogenase (short-subunit alcohol dehydrogenase family)